MTSISATTVDVAGNTMRTTFWGEGEFSFNSSSSVENESVRLEELFSLIGITSFLFTKGLSLLGELEEGR